MPKLNRDGVDIYYEVHGSGPPLILTHGYSSTSSMWQGQIAALSRHYKLVLWDMRGHGQSDYPDNPAAYSEALTVADIAVLKSMSAERANVSHRDASGLARAARGMLTQRDASVMETLPVIKVPSLVVVGADDTPFLAASDYMAAKIPGAQKVVIPAAGHAANIDQPKAFNEAVLAFLDRLDGRQQQRAAS